MVDSDWPSMSMKPGVTTSPCASIVRLADAPVRFPIAAILPSRMPTSPVCQGRARAVDNVAVRDDYVERLRLLRGTESDYETATGSNTRLRERTRMDDSSLRDKRRRTERAVYASAKRQATGK